MKLTKISVTKYFLGLAVLVLLSSCLDDKAEEYQADHDKKLKEFMLEFGLSESNRLEGHDGIYYKIQSATKNNEAKKPTDSSAIVVDLIGYDDVNSVFDVSDYDDAVKFGLDRNDHIYGPARFNMSDLIAGLYHGIPEMKEGENAIFLLSHQNAFGSYNPILYDITLYRVIDDVERYDSLIMLEYAKLVGMDSKFRIHDTLSFGGAYIKSTESNPVSTPLGVGDTVTIKLQAHYIERDTAFRSEVPGRTFFPINDSGEEIKFIYGTNEFPITNILSYALSDSTMGIGDSKEILSPSEYAYGNVGFRHPYTGFNIVPANMNVHYIIELLGVANKDDEGN